MSLARLVARSLRHYWRTGLVVVFGLAVATAVIVGSLVIGDSVRGSIRSTALARLGAVDHALVAPDYFRQQLADDLSAALQAQRAAGRVLPLLLNAGAARNPASDVVVPQVEVVAVTPAFWQLYQHTPALHLSGRAVAINAALARDAGASEGDYLLLTLGRQSKVPTGSLFARRSREDAVRSMRVRVSAILPDRGPGGFRLDAATATPRNVFISLGWLASQLGRPGLANALLVAADGARPPEGAVPLSSALRRTCQLADYGLTVVPNPDRGYLSLESEGVLLRPFEVLAARQAAADSGARPGLTSVYLAETITPAAGGPELAYAVVAAMDPPGDLRGIPAGARQPDDEGFLLSRWAADDLRARVGDTYRLTYLVPSFEQGYRTDTIQLTLRGIVAMAGSGADPGLVPDFEGITDAEHIGDWDPPFPVDLGRVSDRDERYWDLYRAAPRAFVSMNTARRIWTGAPSGEQTGHVTSLRLTPPGGVALDALRADFTRALLERLSPGAAGLAFRPVRQQVLQASRGTSDFSQLFLGMSIFLVFSGAGLAGMLMRLSADRRASEAGIMMACGFTPATAARTIFAEGALLTLFGAALGSPLGILYARAIITALNTWWHHALGSAPLLGLALQPSSIAAGAAAGLLVGLISVGWAARRLARGRALALLSGWQALSMSPPDRPARRPLLTLTLALLAAAALVILAALGAIPPQAGFFAGGAALLVAGLSAASLLLARALRLGDASRSTALLAVRNAAASRARSLLVIGLLACATFVIVAVAANSRDFSALDPTDRSSGTGGFSLRATSSVPLTFDFGTPEGRESLAFSPEDEPVFQGVQVISFLASPGEDISCLNIARPSQPRVLGVPDAMIQRGGFNPITRQPAPGANPWQLLRMSLAEGAIPAFGDAASVRWQLHSALGKRYLIQQADGRPQTFLFTGLLSGSIFQSEILVSEDAFRAMYPGVDAPSYFLLDTPPGAEEPVAQALRASLGDLGLQVRTTREVLNDYIGVQNTYLSMFLALGGLGLLLGTVGMVAVLLRSALERRAEFALMLATGFTRTGLARLLLIEHGGLLLAGIAWGALSALLAVAPQLSSAHSQVNWGYLLFVLSSIMLIGVASCWLAARATVRGSLIEALREE